MTDIYKALAAKVIGKPGEAEVTAEERALAKEAFWGALTAVAQLPGNSALLTALRSSGEAGQQFANIEWTPRWNSPEALSTGISTDGAAAFAIGFFGVLKFKLDDKASCEAIAAQARRFADMVEQTAVYYLGG